MANDKKDITDTVNSDMQRDKEIEKRKDEDVKPTCSMCEKNNCTNNNSNNSNNNCGNNSNSNNNSNNNCSNNSNNNTNMPQRQCGCVGYAYVPSQIFGKTYTAEQGLSNGTMFPELNLNIDEYGKVCKGVGM